MTFTAKANPIFDQVIRDYHLTDNVDTPINNPYKPGEIEYDLYVKRLFSSSAVLTRVIRTVQTSWSV